MKKRIIVVVGTLSIAALIWTLLRPSGAPEQASVDEVTAPVSTEPSAPVAANEPPAQAPPAAAPAATPLPTDPEQRRLAKEERRRAENAQPFHWEPDAERSAELQGDRRELGGRWSGEKTDRAWTSNAAGHVATVMADKGIDPAAVKDVDCRETICRLAVKAPSPRHGDVWATIRAAREVDPQTWTMPDQQADGTYTVDVFFPRDGYRLSSGGGRVADPPRVLQ